LERIILKTFSKIIIIANGVFFINTYLYDRKIMPILEYHPMVLLLRPLVWEL